jgi:hypothetical protein
VRRLDAAFAVATAFHGGVKPPHSKAPAAQPFSKQPRICICSCAAKKLADSATARQSRNQKQILRYAALRSVESHVIPAKAGMT